MTTQQHAGGAHIRVRRYSGSARINHWIVAISFVLLLLSGLSLFHPSLYWLSGLFGGGATVRWLHPWIGCVLVIGFLGLFIRFFWQNLPETTDFVWLARIRHVRSRTCASSRAPTSRANMGTNGDWKGPGTMDKTTIRTDTIDRVIQVIAIIAVLWAIGNIVASF